MKKQEFRRILDVDFERLAALQCAYKKSIGEDEPDEDSFERLLRAIREEKIFFYGCAVEGELVAMCSICRTFSTFDYQMGGVFEDFYILPEYRHQGIARKLVEHAYTESGVSSLTVGCADCDVEMYGALGFAIPLGNLLAYEWIGKNQKGKAGVTVKTIYLCRHSKPEETFQGSPELIPLSCFGKIAAFDFLSRLKIDKSTKVFSSPYKRAYETAMQTGNPIIQDERLIERKIGLRETFTKEMWLGQYVDCDLKNEGGESFRMVRDRMSEAISEILAGMVDGERVVIVSHAAAICAYLQRFCEIEVVDAEHKHRKITYQNDVVLDGAMDTPSCFVLIFEEGISHISYKSWYDERQFLLYEE